MLWLLFPPVLLILWYAYDSIRFLYIYIYSILSCTSTVGQRYCTNTSTLFPSLMSPIWLMHAITVFTALSYFKHCFHALVTTYLYRLNIFQDLSLCNLNLFIVINCWTYSHECRRHNPDCVVVIYAENGLSHQSRLRRVCSRDISGVIMLMSRLNGLLPVCCRAGPDGGGLCPLHAHAGRVCSWALQVCYYKGSSWWCGWWWWWYCHNHDFHGDYASAVPVMIFS